MLTMILKHKEKLVSLAESKIDEGKEVIMTIDVNETDSSSNSTINTIVVENGDTITNSSETIEGQVSVDSVKASI